MALIKYVRWSVRECGIFVYTWLLSYTEAYQVQ